MRLVTILLVMAMLSGCISQKKREDIFHRYARENPIDLAETYADKFPVKTVTVKGRTDTLTVRDTVQVKVPVPVNGGADTIWADCPPTETVYRYINRTDTIMKENTALIVALQGKINELNTELAVEKSLRVSSENQSNNRLYWIIGLAIGLAASMALKIKRLI